MSCAYIGATAPTVPTVIFMDGTSADGAASGEQHVPLIFIRP
jgi:hypothetical protein